MSGQKTRVIHSVQVWIVDLEISELLVEEYRNTLSLDEKQRADGFYFKKDYKHFVACRFALRTILGNVLERAAHEIVFCYSKFEKPFLETDQIHFNVSHANGIALIAVAPTPVGIDIEWHLREIEADDLATRFFSKNEAEAFFQTNIEQRVDAFYSIWTKKEAFIKAIGDGLSYPLDSFTVGIPAADDSLIFEGESGQDGKWHLKSIPLPFTNYSAAIVTEGSLYGMTLNQF